MEGSQKTSLKMLRFLFLVALSVPVHGDLSGHEVTSEFEHPLGSVYVKPANIKPGCARFYISDPIKEKRGTKYWQVMSCHMKKTQE